LCLISGDEETIQGNQGTSSQQQQQQRDSVETLRQNYLSSGKFNFTLIPVPNFTICKLNDDFFV